MPNGEQLHTPTSAAQPQTLTGEEYEKLRASLKRINVKAQRLQTSTLEEIALRELLRRFASVAELVVPLKRQNTQDRSSIDRDWKSCRNFEIFAVRGYLRKGDGPWEIAPVAQMELKAIMATVAKLETELAGGNWGAMEGLCSRFQEEIEDAIQECRRVTEGELREIYTITENL